MINTLCSLLLWYTFPHCTSISSPSMSQVYRKVGECRVAMLKAVIHRGLFPGHRSEDCKEVWAPSLCLLANSWPIGLGRAGVAGQRARVERFPAGKDC